MGITENASASDEAYSAIPMGVKPNAEESTGISITAVVSTSDAAIAPKRNLLWLPPMLIAMTEPLCERILNEWKISHIDIVKNAMVIPCSQSAIFVKIHLPVSNHSPMKNAARVRTVTTMP